MPVFLFIHPIWKTLCFLANCPSRSSSGPASFIKTLVLVHNNISPLCFHGTFRQFPAVQYLTALHFIYIYNLSTSNYKYLKSRKYGFCFLCVCVYSFCNTPNYVGAIWYLIHIYWLNHAMMEWPSCQEEKNDKLYIMSLFWKSWLWILLLSGWIHL